MSEENEVESTPAEQWLEPSPVGSEFMRHSLAMEPAARVPVHKAFAIAPGFNVGMLRKMAEAYKPKRIVVIEHGESGFEVRRLGNNDDVSLFYASLNPAKVEQLAKVKPSEDEEQMTCINRVIAELFEIDEALLVKYDQHGAKFRNANCVGHSYLHRRVSGIAVFRKDAEGSTAAIKRCILRLESEGALRKLTDEETNEMFGISATVYLINKNSSSNT